MFLALHDACVDLGRLEEARLAIARGVPRLVTRVKGLAGTPYARAFLVELAPNAGPARRRGGLRPGAGRAHAIMAAEGARAWQEAEQPLA